MISPRLRLSSNRREWDQGEPAGTVGVVAQAQSVGNVEARPSPGFQAIDIDADNLAEAGVAQWSRRHAQPTAQAVGGIDGEQPGRLQR